MHLILFTALSQSSDWGPRGQRYLQHSGRNLEKNEADSLSIIFSIQNENGNFITSRNNLVPGPFKAISRSDCSWVLHDVQFYVWTINGEYTIVSDYPTFFWGPLVHACATCTRPFLLLLKGLVMRLIALQLVITSSPSTLHYAENSKTITWWRGY